MSIETKDLFTKPFDEEYTICSNCKNRNRCRVFYKLKDFYCKPSTGEEERINYDCFSSIVFLCYCCFGDKRRKENYQPLLVGTKKESLYLPLPNSKDALLSEIWYDQVDPITMPPRAGEAGYVPPSPPRESKFPNDQEAQYQELAKPPPPLPSEVKPPSTQLSPQLPLLRPH
jgi:hypothetical protein